MKLNYLLLLALGVFTFASCGDDDEPTTPDPQSIVEIALADANFSTLVSALERTNLTSVLEGTGPFTVFAPTNAAFTALGVNLDDLSDDALTEILLYHVLGGNVASTDLQDGQTYAGTATTTGPSGTSLSLLIEKSAAGVKCNNTANVTTADVTATNGVIHIIDGVLLPLDIVGHASANSSFSSLVGALSSAPGDLVNVLSGDGPFTVFGPVNSAFDAISDVVATLTPEQLATVLTYHVISGANVTSGALTDGAEVATVAGQNVTVDLSNGVKITDVGGSAVNVVLADVQATNGVIHVIDAVLIPSL